MREKYSQRWVSQRKLIIARLSYLTPANYFQKIPKKKKEEEKKEKKRDNYGACSCPTHEPSKTL